MVILVQNMIFHAPKAQAGFGYGILIIMSLSESVIKSEVCFKILLLLWPYLILILVVVLFGTSGEMILIDEVVGRGRRVVLF